MFNNSLDTNNITSKGAVVLFHTLTECKSVVSRLELSGNQLDDGCMTSLGQFIEKSEHLQNLHISSNKITDKGIETLCDYLIGNIHLKELHIKENEEITDESYQILVDVAKSTYILKINLWDTSISDEKRNSIQELLLIPVGKRDVPIKSLSKSAAKVS